MRRESDGPVRVWTKTGTNMQMEKIICSNEGNNWSNASKISQKQPGRVNLFKSAQSKSKKWE